MASPNVKTGNDDIFGFSFKRLERSRTILLNLTKRNITNLIQNVDLDQ